MNPERQEEPESLELFAREDINGDGDGISALQQNEATQADDQLSLIDIDEDWKREWQGMPEFIQKDLEPYKTIYVHFENRADTEAFSKLIEQRITFNTKSIWYPQAEIGRFADKRYIDES